MEQIGFQEVDRNQCKLIYKTKITDEIESKILVRCIPKDGVYLWEIRATYDKNIPPTTYYRLGKTKTDVRRDFNDTMCWMKITSIRLVPYGDEAEAILTNWMKIPPNC